MMSIKPILSAVALAAALCAAAQAEQAPSPIRSVEVLPTRDYGIVIGEILPVEIRITAQAGCVLETAGLPQPGSAVNDFLELREAGWIQQPQADGTVWRLRLAYQVFKGVREAETLPVPAVPLRLVCAGQAVETQAPTWHFSLMPIIPANLADDAVVLRGGLPLPEYPAQAHWRWLWVFLGGLLGLGVVAAWQAGLPPFRHHAAPFTRAASRLRKLDKRPDIGTWRQGVTLIHAALNETAGYTLFSGQLAGFLADRPQFAGLQTELEQFFALSDRLFFTADAALPDDYPWPRLKTLCRWLAVAGRRG